MPLFMVDVEADGPCPGLYSLVSFAAVKVQKEPLGCWFHAELAPVTDRYLPGALESCGLTRERTLLGESAYQVMPRFVEWLLKHSEGKRPVMISDNPAFDWQFINYYLHSYASGNPFGHSARRVGDLAAGLERDFFASSKWKKLRRTTHTHNPLDDARGNVEALLALAAKHHIRLPGVD